MKYQIMIWLFTFCTIVCSVNAIFYKSNVPDFSRCQVYYSRSGNIYRDFFELSNPLDGNDSMLLDFHFSVLAPSDAHILLAPSRDLTKSDPAYEIVIGAGGNTFSDIRRQQKNAVKASVRDKGLLSGLDVRSFWIHISKDGIIDVGREGEELAFLTWTDPDPLRLKVFSFSTWPGVEAKWYFDCPREDNITSHLQELRRNLTDLERLRRDLLSLYNPYVRPVKNFDQKTDVRMAIITEKFFLDEHKSIFEIKGVVKMSWCDEKLVWNSTEYGDLNELHIFRREIWQPSLYLYNSVDSNGDVILEDTMMIVNSSGHVFWKPLIQAKAWIALNDKGAWPNDIHTCDLLFTFLIDFGYIKLKLDRAQTVVLDIYSDEWNIVQGEIISNEDLHNTTKDVEDDPPAVQLTYVIQRSSQIHNYIFFTPFIFILVALLSTFWVSPFGQLKISLGCISLIISSIMLIALVVLMPSGYRIIPRIVSIYSFSLIACLVCLVIATVVINLSRNQQPFDLPYWISRMLQAQPLRFILICPNVKISEEYGNLNESKTSLKQQTMWILLGVVIDRIAFLCYLGLAIYSLF